MCCRRHVNSTSTWNVYGKPFWSIMLNTDGGRLVSSHGQIAHRRCPVSMSKNTGSVRASAARPEVSAIREYLAASLTRSSCCVIRYPRTGHVRVLRIRHCFFRHHALEHSYQGPPVTGHLSTEHRPHRQRGLIQVELHDRPCVLI